MKRIALLLLCPALYCGFLTGCGNTFQYNGTFNEEVFAQICQDVSIKGARISVPGTLADWGDDFSADIFLENKEDSILYYMVQYDDNAVALAVYDTSEELTEETLKTTPYFALLFLGTDEKPDTSGVAGIVSGDSAESIISTFGEPTRITEIDENGAYNYEYTVSDEQCIVFALNDDKLANFAIMNQSGE